MTSQALARLTMPVEWRQYHEFWRAPAYRWWKGLVAALIAVALIVLGVVVGSIPMIVEMAKDPSHAPTRIEDVVMTPQLFLLNNVMIATFIPAVMLPTWWLVGQRPGWLSSVVGRIRWGWLARCLALIAPIWIVYTALDMGLGFAVGENPFADMHMRDHTWFTLASILGTTVFQCAGEEYLCRGFVPRLLASWIPDRKWGLIVGWLVSSVLFMGLHMSTDVFLNIFYFSFATTATWLVWRTGGLEAAIVLHAVNNLLSEATMPWIDYSQMFNREAGAGSPLGLTVVVAFVAVGFAVERLIRRHRPHNMAAPGRARLAPAPLGARAG